MQLTTFDAVHLQKKFGIVQMSALIDFGQLTTRSRNKLIKALQTGFIPSSTYRGTGRLALAMLQEAGVFYVGLGWAVTWNKEVPPPDGFHQAIKELLEADATATTLKHGRKVHGYSNPANGYVYIETLDPKKHVPQLLAEYVATEEYKQAVQPYIGMLREGQTMEVEIQ